MQNNGAFVRWISTVEVCYKVLYKLLLTDPNGVFTPEQDDDKTNVEPVHSYDAFHIRFVLSLPDLV